MIFFCGTVKLVRNKVQTYILVSIIIYQQQQWDHSVKTKSANPMRESSHKEEEKSQAQEIELRRWLSAENETVVEARILIQPKLLPGDEAGSSSKIGHDGGSFRGRPGGS